jgi:rSAM/selenodomain-associated transferase 2
MISIIIPVLDEEAVIRPCLDSLASWRQRGCEVIIVDGGSTDNSIDIAREHADLVVSGNRGRASQMNAGANHAIGKTLLFLHVDTLLPEATDELADSLVSGNMQWGRFDVELSGQRPVFRIISFFINLRSRLDGIATGDQAIFVQRSLFTRIGGFPDIPLMEDIELSRRLLKTCRPVCLNTRVVTSSRRWENSGVMKTVLMMWYLRAAYWLGARPQYLARIYGR